MYIYFDTNGTIKEIINDKSIRNGSNEANKIYCYLEGEPEIDDIWYLQELPSGELSNEVSFKNSTITKAIPYDAKRDMKYFKDFEQYTFYVFTLNTFLTSQKGLNIATIRVSVDNTIWALGELTFNVQKNVINVDNGITQSQYDYLLLAYASRTLSEQTGSDLDDLIDDKLNAKIGDLASGSPKVFDTEANIEALHDDYGIAVATDTGDIWVWNDTQQEYQNTNYKYIADVSLFYTKTQSDNTFAPKSTAITHTGSQLQDYSGNNVYPKIADKYSLLPNNSNIDNIFNESSYFLFYAYTYSGTFPTPLNANFGFLTTNKLNTTVSVQWYYYPIGNGLYYRASDNGNWISWKKINTMADNSITTSMLQNLSITTPKISNNSVDGNKIATRFNYVLDKINYDMLNANSKAKLDQNVYQGDFYNNYFRFKGATNDNWLQTVDITVDTTKTYVLEVYGNSTNFEFYLYDNGTYTKASRTNRGYARIEFTPTTSNIAVRFDVDVADTYGYFYNFKLYEKATYKGEVEANSKFDYVGANRINFTIDLDGVDIPCYIYLPTNYSKFGKPCEAIMICHGSGQVISDNSTDNINIVNALVNAGFVVFDCNGNTSNTAQAWGCPKNQEAYLKAYEYVQNHFNVKKQINVYGLSMGGLSAMNFVTWFPSLVKALGLGAPCIDLYNEGWEFSTGRKNIIASTYGMATYDVSKTYGCNPSLRIVEISGTKYLFNLPPIKLWHGTSDTEMPYEYSVNFIQYANNGGNYALIHLIEGAGHEVCYGGNATVVTEIVNWFKQFANND